MLTGTMGRLAIRFEGTGPIADEIAGELQEGLQTGGSTQHVVFRLVPNLPRMKCRRNGSVLVGKRGVAVERDGYVYAPSFDSGRVLVKLAADGFNAASSGLSETIKQARNWNYLTPAQWAAKDFLYNIFDWSTQLAQLELEQSYIHASSMKVGERGVAVVGWGGVGKTTSLLKLVMENDWKFLSDDLGVVDASGQLFRTPKRLQIYGYNIQGQPALAKRMLDRRSALDRISWAYKLKRHGGNGVRRRISAQALFGADHVGDQAPLTDLIYLERTNSDKVTLHDIEPSEVAQRMAAIIMAELEPYGEICREAKAGGAPFMLPPADVEDRTREVLEKAFSGANARLIRVGNRIDPDELTRIIARQI